MNRSTLPRWTLFALCLTTGSIVASASPTSILIKQLGRFTSRQSAGTAADVAARESAEAIAKRVGGKLAARGGDDIAEIAGRLVARDGPDVLRALDNAADPAVIIRALDDLPADQVAAASARLAAGATGHELAELTSKHGVKTLAAEVAHPGLAVKFVGKLGDDGAKLATRLSGDQAVQLAKHVDDIAVLPASTRTRLLEKIGQQPAQFAKWMGRFVRDNPGKVLFTAAATTAILNSPDAFFGSIDGGVGTPGMVERVVLGGVDRVVTPALKIAGYLALAVVIGVTVCSLLWIYLRRHRTGGPTSTG